MDERLRRWRLLLGPAAASLPNDELNERSLREMDEVLDFLYGPERKGGTAPPAPQVNRWLGDIRKYFATPMVQLLQRDALERLGLERMLLEPELLASLQPDVHLAARLLALKEALPERTRETARAVVRRVAEDLERRLRKPLEQALRGSLRSARRTRNPRLREIDWHLTIRRNLQHYSPELQTLIPHEIIGRTRKGSALRHVIVLCDQSGSMASSMVYAAVFGSVLLSVRALKTSFVAFSTEVVDLSEWLHDPVELLFGTQLGGGTDIAAALHYARSLVEHPRDGILVLISDLFEGGKEADLLRQAAALHDDGLTVVVLLALDDEGAGAFNQDIAARLAALGIPAFACTPQLFPELMAAAIEKKDLAEWMGKFGLSPKGA